MARGNFDAKRRYSRIWKNSLGHALTLSLVEIRDFSTVLLHGHRKDIFHLLAIRSIRPPMRCIEFYAHHSDDNALVTAKQFCLRTVRTVWNSCKTARAELAIYTCEMAGIFKSIDARQLRNRVFRII